jgi:hypothetical protein
VHAFGEWLQATPLSVTIQSVTWIIPLLQSIHIVMIGVVFVSSVMISLRVLGRVRADEPFVEVWQRFAPWMWNGLVVMLVTGLILTLGEPEREFGALSFWLKMGLLVIAVVTTGVFGRTFAGAANASAATGIEFSTGSKVIAITTIAIWLAIIFLGRAIAYDVEIWGSLSLR